jgi:hypothetical protein
MFGSMVNYCLNDETEEEYQFYSDSVEFGGLELLILKGPLRH